MENEIEFPISFKEGKWIDASGQEISSDQIINQLAKLYEEVEILKKKQLRISRELKKAKNEINYLTPTNRGNGIDAGFPLF